MKISSIAAPFICKPVWNPAVFTSYFMATPEAQRNLNTILLAVAIAVLAFIANSSVENGKDISAIKASQLTRGEVEMKIEGIRKDYVDISARIVALEQASRTAAMTHPKP